MLILTRRIGEFIVIDNKIEVQVLGVKGNQVRMGITAPKDMPIHRSEIQDLVNKEKEAQLEKNGEENSSKQANQTEGKDDD